MRRFLCVLAMLAALALGAAPAHAAPNYTGLWWNSSESGWGLNLSHQGTSLFASWFTYDAGGEASWFVMSGSEASPGSYTGPLYRSTGPAFNAPFNPASVAFTQVGTGTITFSSATSASFSSSVDGNVTTKAITTQLFDVRVPTCLWNQQPSPALSINYQGLWWNPSESGWLLNIAHQGDKIFATVFVYDLDGTSMWLVMSNGVRAGNAYSGALYRTTGPAYNAPWNPVLVQVTQVGNMTITFADGSNATLAYSVNGSSVSKAITRQVLSGSGTTCGFAPEASAAPTATGGPAQATVSFAAPASNGGFPIASYTVRASPGGASATGPASPITVTGLTPGTGYQFTVTATNAVGEGAASPPSGNAVPTNAPTMRPNDFSADGQPDLVWSNTANGATYLWYMNGPTLAVDAFITQVDPSWKIQGVADFNGDGHPDLVWRNTATGSTFVWYMNFSAFLSDAPLFTLPPEWVIQGVADFNGDGKPDFLLRNTVSGNAFVWFFNDATPVGDQFLFGIDPLWKVEAVTDLDHDGRPDLMFRNTRSGLAFVWNTQYSGGTLSLGSSSAPIFGIDTVWEIVQWEDWNGDGDPDLVFRNRDTGLVFVWYLIGTRLGGSDFITQIDPSWEIVPRR